MTVPHDDFVDDPLGAIFRSELALLDRTFNVNVVSLVEGQGDSRKVPVERQIVPVGAFLPLAITVLEAIRLPQSQIRDGHTGGQISRFALFDNVTRNYYTIHLHNND
jgi:hypothetical protein